MTDQHEKTYVVCGKVVVRKIGSDTLLVPVSGPAAGGRVFPINDSAEIIWNCLIEGHSVGGAAEELAKQYGIDEAEALTDCRECAERFVNEELLEEKG